MAQAADFQVDQGATFKVTVEYTDPDDTSINLTGYSARMQVRRGLNERGAPLFEASTANSFAVLDALAGRVDFTIPDDVTVKFNTKRLVYDIIFISPGGETTRIMQGVLLVSPMVTV